MCDTNKRVAGVNCVCEKSRGKKIKILYQQYHSDRDGFCCLLIQSHFLFPCYKVASSETFFNAFWGGFIEEN